MNICACAYGEILGKFGGAREGCVCRSRHLGGTPWEAWALQHTSLTTSPPPSVQVGTSSTAHSWLLLPPAQGKRSSGASLLPLRQCHPARGMAGGGSIGVAGTKFHAGFHCGCVNLGIPVGLVWIERTTLDAAST